MKKIVVIILVLTVNLLFSHDVKYEKVILKKWNFEGKILKGSFLFQRNDSVFIEDANHKIIGIPTQKLSCENKIYIKNKTSEIKILNKRINENQVSKHQIQKNNNVFTVFVFILLILLILFVSLFRYKRKIRLIIPIITILIGVFFLSFTDPNVIRNAFLSFAPNVNTFWDSNYFYVESKGIPTTHSMMVGISNHGWQQQVPIPQCYIGSNAWSIPLNPVMAANPISVNQSHFTRGAIAIAVNGVPIFNPYTNTGVDAFLDGQLDNFGGHCGRGDDYHYHTAPLHLYNQTNSNLPIAYAFDGFAVYGSLEPNGTAMTLLDANHGHNYNGEYHYHGTSTAPYMIARFAGEVTEDATMQLIPQAHANPVRTENWTPLNGSLITSCTPNINNNGYNLSYTLNGNSGYATNYSWNGLIYTFNYVTPSGTNTISYNGFNQCDVPLFIQENVSNNKLEVFPNPFYDKINIKNSDLNQIYILYNDLGQILFLGKNIEEHNFSNIAKGSYYLQFKGKNKTIKLIKK